MRAALSGFIDHSSAETEVATTTALTEIAAWVENADSLTIRHVIKKHLSPAKTGVGLGPYSEDEFREIVATIFEDAGDKRDRRWDRIKTFVPWILSGIGLVATIGGLIIGYLKFVHGQ